MGEKYKHAELLDTGSPNRLTDAKLPLATLEER